MRLVPLVAVGLLALASGASAQEDVGSESSAALRGGSMIGAIVLTLRHRENIKRQSIPRQVARSPETAVEVVTVKPGQGL